MNVNDWLNSCFVIASLVLVALGIFIGIKSLPSEAKKYGTFLTIVSTVVVAAEFMLSIGQIWSLIHDRNVAQQKQTVADGKRQEAETKEANTQAKVDSIYELVSHSELTPEIKKAIMAIAKAGTEKLDSNSQLLILSSEGTTLAAGVREASEAALNLFDERIATEKDKNYNSMIAHGMPEDQARRSAYPISGGSTAQFLARRQEQATITAGKFAVPIKKFIDSSDSYFVHPTPRYTSAETTVRISCSIAQRPLSSCAAALDDFASVIADGGQQK